MFLIFGFRWYIFVIDIFYLFMYVFIYLFYINVMRIKNIEVVEWYDKK